MNEILKVGDLKKVGITRINQWIDLNNPKEIIDNTALFLFNLHMFKRHMVRLSAPVLDRIFGTPEIEVPLGKWNELQHLLRKTAEMGNRNEGWSKKTSEAKRARAIVEETGLFWLGDLHPMYPEGIHLIWDDRYHGKVMKSPEENLKGEGIIRISVGSSKERV